MQTQTPKYQGDPSIKALANGLGTLGRYGDEYMVHAAHGETVVPAEILEANPELKQQLFQQMRLMGIKNPNRYVVGNSLNSINPLTGQPEFFFKKIFRAIKRVVKKIAPIVVPIIGNMIAPGIGGPIASALYSKATGGSWGDALKSAALSYGASALGSGVKGIMNAAPGSGMSGFFSGLKDGALAPFNAASNLFTSGANNPLAQGIFGPRGMGLAFDSAKSTLGTSFSAPGSSFMQRAFDTVTPSYQTFGGGQTYQPGGNTTSAEQQATSQKSGYDYSAKDPTQPIGSGGGGGGGLDANKEAVSRLNPIDGYSPDRILGGSNAQYASGTYDPATAMTPGENAVRGAFTPQSGYTDIAGTTTNAVGDAVSNTATVAQEGSKLGNAYDWIKRNRYLVAAAGAGGLYYLSQEEEDPMPDRDEFERMSDPERAAYNDFNKLSSAEKKGQRGYELLQQAGIRPRYSPADLARITGIGLDDATNYQTNTFGQTGFAEGGLGTLAQTGNLEQANAAALQSQGEGAPFVHENKAYIASSAGAQLQSPAGEAPSGMQMMSPTTPQLGTPTPADSMQTGLATMTDSPNLMKRLTSGQGVVTPDGGGASGGNPLFTAMIEQAKNAMNNRQDQKVEMQRAPVIAPLYQQLNEALVTKRVNPNNIQGGLRAVMQLAPANNNVSSSYENTGGGRISQPMAGNPQKMYMGRPFTMANGGEVEGPGTGTSDSIPANLSDGEFVMTAEAVRNAGGGDRNMGAARMYDLMNRFERGTA